MDALPANVIDRFTELGQLRDGWFDGEGVALDPAAILAAQELTAVCLDVGWSRPGIFAIPEGGVQLEWATPKTVTSIEISGPAEFHLFHLPADANTSTTEEVTTYDEVRSFMDVVLATPYVRDTSEISSRP